MAFFDSDIKERIRESIDIVDLVSSYGYDLKRQGGLFVTHCPWHNDTRPSLQIHPVRQTFKCWVCDKGGDIFAFVQESDRVDFREALQQLAEKAGIPLEPVSHARPKAAPGSPHDKRTVKRALAWAEERFHQFLRNDPAAEAARDYLASRHVTPESIERFRIGFSPDNGQWLMRQAAAEGFSPQVMVAAGLAGETEGRRYDFFRGRVLFSIRNLQSDPIAFGGRVLPGAPSNQGKYVNTRDTSVFAKHREIYALDLARQALRDERHLIVVEGYTDVVAAHQCGVNNAVAVLGTALTVDHVKILRRFADRISLVLDGDDAGQRRAGEVLEHFVAQQVDLRVLTLPDGMDPCDFFQQYGREQFLRQLAGAADALEHKIRVETAGVDLARETDRANKALEAILSTFSKAPRLTSATSHDHRLREEQLLSRLARVFGVEEAEVRRRLKDLRAATPTTPVFSEPAQESKIISSVDALELELLEVLSIEPSLVEDVIESKLDRDLLKGESVKEILDTIVELATEQSVDFGRVMSSLANPLLKNIWATLAHRAELKSETATASARTRLLETIDRINERYRERERQLAEADLPEMTLEEQIQSIQQLIDERRAVHGKSQAETAHGRSDPKEG